MNYFLAGMFGAIQGVTEFLPVSSSGHLIIFHKLTGLSLVDDVAFDVILHLSTLFAVVYFFRKDILKMIKAWFLTFFGKKSKDGFLSWMIILATIPAAIFGLTFENYIENNFRSIFIVVFMLVLVGILFILVENYSKKNKSIELINSKSAVLIGFAQAIALIPGTSRSGITIVAGLMLGLNREAAIKFSFLMSIPIILGANLNKIPKIFASGIPFDQLYVTLIAFIFSFLFGVLTIKYFLKYSNQHSLKVFAYYRFILAFILLCIFL